MAFDLGDELKKFVLAGIGAVAITAEKGKEIIDELVKKGEITVTEGKHLNEELSRKMKEKFSDVMKDNVNITITKNENPSKDDILSTLDKMSKEELKAVKEKLMKLENDSDKPTNEETVE